MLDAYEARRISTGDRSPMAIFQSQLSAELDVSLRRSAAFSGLRELVIGGYECAPFDSRTQSHTIYLGWRYGYKVALISHKPTVTSTYTLEPGGSLLEAILALEKFTNTVGELSVIRFRW